MIEDDILSAEAELDAELGVEATLTRTTAGAYDNRTGKVAQAASEELPIVVRLGKRQITTENGAKQIIQTARSQTEMKAGDYLAVGNLSFSVLAASPSMARGVVTSWRADIEGKQA